MYAYSTLSLDPSHKVVDYNADEGLTIFHCHAMTRSLLLCIYVIGNICIWHKSGINHQYLALVATRLGPDVGGTCQMRQSGTRMNAICIFFHNTPSD